MFTKNIKVEYVAISSLKLAAYNPRKHSEDILSQIKTSITKFGVVDPIIVNAAPKRNNIVIGGHLRLKVVKELGHKTIPVVYVHISDTEKEKELNLRLNKNVGEFDMELLAEFDETLLSEVGFDSQELDEIFDIDEETPEVFDLKEELRKLDIQKVSVKKGDRYLLGEHHIMCGDSTVKEDVLKLMGKQKADMCFTDPPYILNYLKGKKRHGKATEGFGLKRDRKYLETDTLPDNFTELWMQNVAEIQKPNFSIIVFENPKNLRTIWNELEKYWTYRNTIVWRLPNRVQGFSAKYKFFNKHDIALVGTQGKISLNTDPEGDELLDNEYENALFATSGSPHWEGYNKGTKYCPTDFIEYVASDKKNSGQGVIFGTKPIEILVPYLKVLTKRDNVVFEPFGGSGSTLIACEKMKRTCYLMEKVPTYTEVIIKRWEKLTGKKAKKV